MIEAFTAVGLMLALEGALYALFPVFMKRMAAQAVETPSDTLRIMGVIAAGLGVGCVWLVRG